jgi:UDP-glucose 4-epimerase
MRILITGGGGFLGAAIAKALIPGAELFGGPCAYRHGERVEIVRNGALDVGRAAVELGWKPRYDIRAGLAAYVNALRPAASK